MLIKAQPRTGHEDPYGGGGGVGDNPTLSLTTTLYEGGWSMQHPELFTTWTDARHTSYRRLGGPQARPGKVRKISHPPGFDPRMDQPIASLYTELKWVGISLHQIFHKNDKHGLYQADNI
jgi:hypothetical protein